MTDQALSEQDPLQLLASFAHVEHDDLGPGTHEKYLQLAAELAKRYGLPCRVSVAMAGDRCCGQH